MQNVATANARLGPLRPNPVVQSRRNISFLDRFFVWTIVFVAKHRPQLLVKFIEEKASELATGMTMGILDRERIMHCSLCPNRFGLRKLGMKYFCPNHIKE